MARVSYASEATFWLSDAITQHFGWKVDVAVGPPF